MLGWVSVSCTFCVPRVRATTSTRSPPTALERNLAAAKKAALRAGRSEPQWLFPNDEGKPLDESRVRKEFNAR
jgi:hypothetical protein